MKKLLFLVAGFLACSQQAFAQRPAGIENLPAVDVVAKFPGDSLIRFLSSHLRYPDSLRAAAAQGKVVLGMLIEKDGRLTKAWIERPSCCPAFDAEALRVVRLMPKWMPALKNGQPAASVYRQPIAFHLN